MRAHLALNARHRVTGQDISEIVRSIIDHWADEEIRAATLLHDALRREGIVGTGRE